MSALDRTCYYCECKVTYSYHVDMGNGQVRHIHANKIRKFVARVHGCGVISYSGSCFGNVWISNSLAVFKNGTYEGYIAVLFDLWIADVDITA